MTSLRPPTIAAVLTSFGRHARRLEAEAEDGNGAWTVHAWRILHAVARELRLYCACSKRHERPEDGEQREWLWDLSWYDPRPIKRFQPPLVVIEHENSHHDDDFINDFWKVMVAHAPLRLMIGYTGPTEKAMEKRLHAIHEAVHDWTFPQSATDAIVLRRYGTPSWDYLVRTAGSETFARWTARNRR
jgi:hypothetical protein